MKTLLEAIVHELKLTFGRSNIALSLAQALVLFSVVPMMPALADSTFSTGFPGGGGGGGASIPGNTLGAHNFANSINTSGVISGAQPSFSDISGVASAAQLPSILNTINTSPHQFKNLRNGFTRVANKTGMGHILFAGDSTVSGYNSADSGNPGERYNWSYPAFVRKALAASFIPTCEGVVWLSSIEGILTGSDPRLSLGDYANTVGGGVGNCLYSQHTSLGDFTFTPTYTYDTIEVYMLGNSNAGPHVFQDSTDLGALTPSGTFQTERQVFTCARRAGTIHVTQATSGGTFYLVGIAAYDSQTPAMRITNAGISGSPSATWAATGAASPLQSCRVANPDCTIYEEMINDASGPVSVPTWVSNATTIINYILAPGTTDAVINSCIPSQSALVTQEALYTAAMIPLAQSLGIAYLDLFNHYSGTGADEAALGWYSGTVHFNKLGYFDRSQLVCFMITPESKGLEDLSGPIVSIAGSAGTLNWSQPTRSTGNKKVVISLAGYTNAGTTVITFPVPFTRTPSVTGNGTALTVTTLTTTAITVPVSTTQTGTIVVEGM